MKFLFSTGGSVCSHLLTLVPRSRIFLPWRWSRYVHTKRRLTQDLHSAISQKPAFFIALSSSLVVHREDKTSLLSQPVTRHDPELSAPTSHFRCRPPYGPSVILGVLKIRPSSLTEAAVSYISTKPRTRQHKPEIQIFIIMLFFIFFSVFQVAVFQDVYSPTFCTLMHFMSPPYEPHDLPSQK
jgi:hypothetical protein